MPCCCVQSSMLGRRLRKRCSRSAVWLPGVTFSIDVGLGWCLQRAWVLHLQPGNELGISSAQPKPSRASTHPSSSSPTVAQTSCGAKKKLAPIDARRGAIERRCATHLRPLCNLEPVRWHLPHQCCKRCKLRRRRNASLTIKSLAVNCTCAVSCRRRAAYLRPLCSLKAVHIHQA